MAKRLTRLKIREVSSVDRGAGEGVRVMLFKRDAAKKPEGKLAKAILGDGVTIRKDAVIDFGYTGAGVDISGVSDEVKNRVEDSVAVFDTSVGEIMASADPNKEALLEQSFVEFADHVEATNPGVPIETLTALVVESLGATEKTDMPALSEKEIDALKASAAEAEKLKADLAKKDEEIAKRDAELAFAKLSDAHKAHAEKLSGDAKAKFLAMSADERDAAMRKALEKRDEDPVFKAMNERLAKAEGEAAELRKRLDAEQDEKEKVAFGKKAVEVYGQPEAFGETLRKAYKGDAAAQAEVEKVTTSLRRIAEQSNLFKNFGSGGGNADSAKEQMTAKAEELRKLDSKLTREQAYTKVLMDPSNAELARRVRAEERAAN